MARLPMFPLGTTMLPGSLLQLHVFEPRYRELMHAVLDEPAHAFGVVLIERGREVGGGDQRHSVGAVATVLQAASTPDGRYGVVAGVGRRLRVRQWLGDDPYPCADVEEWPDEDEPVAADEPIDLHQLLHDVNSRTHRLAALAVEVGEPSRDQGVPLSDDPSARSYQLSWLAPLGDADRYRLLCAPGPAERLRLLDELLDDAEQVLRFRLQE